MRTLMRRREFLVQSIGAGFAGLAGTLPAVRAREARAVRSVVQLSPELEPLVRWLEDTPSERLVPELAHRIRSGTVRYRDLVAALLLAGVRNVQPRPYVGYKFHTVLVIHSCHLAALDAPPQLRWLPILWAAHYFKRCQAADVREGDWHMAPVDEARVPPPQKAEQAFVEAMERWDEEAADVAAAGFTRAAGLNRVFRILFRYAARDYRSIGHKAIFVANAYRTLQTIGPQHAEPVVRSLAYALLNRQGEDPLRGDHPADRPWRVNRTLVTKIRSGWSVGRPDAGAADQLVTALRDADDRQAAELVVELLNSGVAPQSIWDGLFAAAAELVYRQPGIVSLHAMTTTNAIHHLFQLADCAETRRILLLQNASFLPLFRGTMRQRGAVSERSLKEILSDGPAAEEPHAVLELLAEGQREAALRAAVALAADPGRKRALEDAVRVSVISRANDPHDYKLGSAVLEDAPLRSQPWSSLMIAASLLCLPHAAARETPVLRVVGEVS